MCKYLFLENKRKKSSFMEEHFFEHFWETQTYLALLLKHIAVILSKN